MALTSALPAFIRDSSGIKLITVDPKQQQQGITLDSEFPLEKVKVAAWSPTGNVLAFVDPAQGVCVLEISDVEVAGNGTGMKVIEGTSKSTQGLFWSPLGSTLVTVGVYQKGSTEPNLQLWRRAGGKEDCESGGGKGEYLCAASFVHPKLEPKHQVVKWNADESLCCRLTPDGSVHVHDGAVMAGAPLLQFQLPRAAENFEFAPLRPRLPLRARLAIFVPDVRDDLQRAAAPAEVSIWEVSGPEGTNLQEVQRAKAKVESGQMAELKWCPSGSALLAHCTTEVDDSGKSYYGSSKLLLLSSDGQCEKDLTEVTSTSNASGLSVQAVDWSPTRDEFILIRGFQPAQVSLWSWDARVQRITLAQVLTEKAHRNFVTFNHFGSLVCIAGFGNLAGEMDFYGRCDDERCEFVRVSSCVANCTVSAEWGPDGRHLMTAVLFPRMRVDNGLGIWHALSGEKVLQNDSEELYEVCWRPEQQDSLRFIDVSIEEINHAGSLAAAARENGLGNGVKKKAYKPPGARGGGDNMVAAMMRGEVAAPEERKKPWNRGRDGEEERNGRSLASPSMGPSSDPKPPASPQQPQPCGSPTPGKKRLKDEPLLLPPSGPASPPPSRPPPPPEAAPPPPPAAWTQKELPGPEAAAPEMMPHPAAGQPGGAGATAVSIADRLQTQEHRSQEQQRQLEQRQLMEKQLEQMEQQRQVQKLEQQQQQQHRLEQRHLEQHQRQFEQQRQLEQQEAALQALAAGTPGGYSRSQMEAARAYLAQHQQHQQQHRQQLLQQQLSQLQLLAARQHQQQAAQQQAQEAALAAALGLQRQQAEQQRAEQQRAEQQRIEEQKKKLQEQQLEQLRRQQQLRQAQVQDQSPCPATGWQYIDPKGNVQGPFNLIEMQLWNAMGFFQPDLLMRCDQGDAYIELCKLFPPGSQPFESPPRRVPANNGGTKGGR